MKTRHSSNTSRAFTLIELLVVITIIALLTSLVAGAYQSVIRRGHELEARSAIRSIANAVQQYRVEMGRFPVPNSGQDETIDLDSGCALLKVLLGENVNNLNRPQRAFLDNVPMAKGGVNGLAGREDQFSFVDPWGTPYRVTMDTDYDNRVANPDADNAASEIAKNAAKFIPYSVIVESAGVDKKFGTQDDIVSWR